MAVASSVPLRDGAAHVTRSFVSRGYIGQIDRCLLGCRLSQGRNDPVLPPRPILLEVLQHIARDPQGDEFSRPWNCRGPGRGLIGGLRGRRLEGGFRCIARVPVFGSVFSFGLPV